VAGHASAHVAPHATRGARRCASDRVTPFGKDREQSEDEWSAPEAYCLPEVEANVAGASNASDPAVDFLRVQGLDGSPDRGARIWRRPEV
jgi:hypothetical protein